MQRTDEMVSEYDRGNPETGKAYGRCTSAEDIYG